MSTATATREVVINACFGGFGLSDAAVEAYAARKGWTIWTEPDWRFSSLITHHYKVPPEQYHALHDEIEANIKAGREDSWKRLNEKDWIFSDRDVARDDPDLVAVVRELGTDEASDKYARLVVVSIPADAEWEISEYDGSEHIAEKHRTWYAESE